MFVIFKDNEDNGGGSITCCKMLINAKNRF